MRIKRIFSFNAVFLFFLLFSSTSLAENKDKFALKLVNAAKKQIGITVGYDGSYRRLKFPLGNVPLETGVCSDVIVRSYRTLGIDLQVLVHNDMVKNFSKYPNIWGLKRTDTNIDHRRVPNLARFFARKGRVLKISKNAEDYAPGNIVTWNLGKAGFNNSRSIALSPVSTPHIGIISDKKAFDTGLPLVIHNIGGGAEEDSILFDYKITGHFSFQKGSS